MRLAKTFTVSVLLLAAASCNSNESVAAFAKCREQLSDLLPRVAAIPYKACVDSHLFQQIDNAADFPDRDAAEKECTLQKEVRERMAKEYGVLALYLEVLEKLATGKASASMKSIAANSAKLGSFSTPHQAEVSGLAGVISSVYLSGRTSHALRQAIATADPHVQILCKAFTSEITPAILGGLQLEERQLETLYKNNRSQGAMQLLLLRQFDIDHAQISENRELARHYAAALEKLAAAHARLYKDRNLLNARGTLDDLESSSRLIAAELKAAEK